MRTNTEALLRQAAVVGGMVVVCAVSGFAQQSAAGSTAHDRFEASFRGEHRTRLESLNGQFRANTALPRTEDQWFSRTSIRTDLSRRRFGATIEVMDSRAYNVRDNGLTNTGTVNTTDLVNANATLEADLFGGGEGRFLVGRYTMSIGSRRYVIRNGYRNTVNTFTGVDYVWNGNDGDHVHAFWTLPVRRRPFDGPSLRDNEFEWDDQDKDLQFYGLFGSRYLGDATTLEVFAFGLHEDAPNTRNRRLITPGARLFRPAKPGAMSFEFEAALQFGDSQATVGGPTLDHSAWFGHASVGYTMDAPLEPSVRLAIDYASGDRDPTDGDNNRFDRLYGAPRFDFGPTGLWGVIQRSNFQAPELRVTVKPCSRSNLMVAYRDLQLASTRDVWVGSGVVDPTGRSGRQVGRHIEAVLQYELVDETLVLEIGGAYMAAGGFLDRAPNARGGDSRYAYAQVTLFF